MLLRPKTQASFSTRPALGLAALLVGVFLFSLPAYCQGGFGTITGRVLDPASAAVPGALLRVTNTEPGLTSETSSDSGGSYTLLQLLPGLYDVNVEVAGFKKLERKGIRVQVDDRIQLDLLVEVGTLAESVTVVGETTALRTQDAQTGEVVTRALIHDLPQLQRDPLRLLAGAGNIQGHESLSQPRRDTRST